MSKRGGKSRQPTAADVNAFVRAKAQQRRDSRLAAAAGILLSLVGLGVAGYQELHPERSCLTGTVTERSDDSGKLSAKDSNSLPVVKVTSTTTCEHPGAFEGLSGAALLIGGALLVPALARTLPGGMSLTSPAGGLSIAPDPFNAKIAAKIDKIAASEFEDIPKAKKAT